MRLSITMSLGLGLTFLAFAQKPVLVRSVLTGHPTSEMIRNDFVDGMPSFRSCHQSHIEKGGGKVNGLTLKFNIGLNGFVNSPLIEEDAPKTLKDCLIASLVAIQFQPYEAEKEIEVKQPLIFHEKEL